MGRKLAVTSTFLILFWGVLVSCQADAPIVEPTGTAVSTQQAELSTDAAVPPANTTTPETSPTANATLEPTVPTPSFLLTQREPTLTEIETFLSQSPILFFYLDRGLESISLNDYFTENNLSEHTEIFHEDINGDGESDLILADLFPFFAGDGFLMVTLWEGNHYGRPLVVMDGAKYQPGLRVTFEDWTYDTIPEVIFDFRSDAGGPGFSETTWKRYVIQCQASCHVVLWGITGQISSYTSVGLITTTIERTLDEKHNPSMTIIDESFYAPDIRGFGHISSSYRVFTSTMKTYTWNGTIFEQISENILEPEYTVTSNSVLSATSPTGDTATITSELDESDSYRAIFRCTLIYNDRPIDESFECLPDFTKVFWQDITNNGTVELVVLATGLGTQHLLAFAFNDLEVTQIADVEGDIIRSDLFGVRLKDIDEDGQPEILAGRGYVTEASDCKIYEGVDPEPRELCWWFELDLREQVYRWNGQIFVPESDE